MSDLVNELRNPMDNSPSKLRNRAADEIERLTVLLSQDGTFFDELCVANQRIAKLEGVIKDTLSSFYTEKPPYYQVHHEVGDMLEKALQEVNDER